MAMSQLLRSEWTKIYSVRSTVWTLGLAAALTISLGALVSVLSRNGFDDLSRQDQQFFDPTVIGFSGMGLGQLPMVVFGVLVVSGEYSTGTIRTSLAAVPQRSAFLFAKVCVGTALALAVGLLTSFTTFLLSQAVLGPHRTGLGAPGVLRAVIGGGLYLTLITVLSMGVAAMLRSPTLSLGILLPFFFLISNVLGNVPATAAFGRFLPDQAGGRVMQVVEPLNDDVPYGPWGGLAIMTAWTGAALAGSLLLINRRDA